MSSAAISRLTERERAYLRLVHEGLSSKEIAIRFGNVPKSVDKAIQSAMGKLGTSSRVVAAQILVDSERGNLPPQSPALADPIVSDIIATSEMDTDWRVEPASPVPVRQDPSVFRTDRPARWLRLPIRRHKGDRNDLSTWDRLGWAAIIAVAIPVLLGSLTVGLWALGRIYLALSR